MLKLLLFYLCLLKTIAYHGSPVIWDKIAQVNTRVSQFLNDRGINNCFEFEEDNNNLHLKCWTDNELVNVDIIIYKNEDVAYI